MEKKVNELEGKLKQLEKEYEESQQYRFEYESEVLEIKFQLSDLKTEREAIEKYLIQKDEEINRLNK